MPGYTHLQRAQPVLLAHHLLAYVAMLDRDRERFADCGRRVNVLPLGSAALAGAAFAIDREALARDLGFAAPSSNSMDAVADRDYVVEFLAAAAVLGMHCSRLAADLTCGPPRSSASSSSPTRSPPARRSCPRRRIPTSPS